MSSGPTGPLGPRCPRYHALEIWRGVACLFVVIFHTTLIFGTVYQPAPDRSAWTKVGEFILQITSHLHLGVPMFFVISGYCISATADAGRLRRLPAADYFSRRLRRIFPPFWAALLLQAAVLLVIDVWLFPELLSKSILPIARPWTLSATQYLGNITLTESWRAQFFGAPTAYILGQSWTLCYEEQFYLVTGLCLFLARKHIFGAALFVSLFVVALRPLADKYSWPIFGTFLDGHWLMFAAGILVYWTRNYGRSSGPAYAVLLAGAVYAHWVPNKNLLISCIFAAILLALHRFDRWPNLPRMAPLRALGAICYSLYLVHAPIARGTSQYFHSAGFSDPWSTLLIVLPISVLASIALGAAFWWVVERRFLNRPRVEG